MKISITLIKNSIENLVNIMEQAENKISKIKDKGEYLSKTNKNMKEILAEHTRPSKDQTYKLWA
jgi:hypothetical protein